ncbi:MAG: Rieske 2Fe-2S domain-containing protein [Segniliparus sp.]|uniref:Rieske 2Fe-2S domain-containing protein n=1 Tax=Segniliparus sp. TaxID=2804064 RepID=UPI003F4195C2
MLARPRVIRDSKAPVRDPRADEYPMPFVPFGWYAVLRSKELPVGKLVSLYYFGRALIAFRGPDGNAAVRDAYCPHYGAHLGGGKLVGGAVECPFHGWRFDAQGACVHAPFAERVPKVAIGGLPVLEHSGLVFVYVGPDEPSWEPGPIPETTSPQFAEPIDDRVRVRVHIQEMRENIVDESHFHYIHRQAEPPAQNLQTDGGPFAEIKGRIRRRVLGRDLDNTFDCSMSGPGVMVVRTHGPALSVTAIALTTPVDDTTSEIRMLYLLRKPAKAPFLVPFYKLVFKRLAFPEVRHEMRIWDSKIHQARPVMLPHEQGIKALRRWYKQFYPAESTASSDRTTRSASPES